MAVQMYVIAFTPLIVEAHNPNAVLGTDHAIFEPMFGWVNRRWIFPNNELDNAAVGTNTFVFCDRERLLVVYNANTLRCCQSRQHLINKQIPPQRRDVAAGDGYFAQPPRRTASGRLRSDHPIQHYRARLPPRRRCGHGCFLVV
ncbi:hypothetical protein G6M23_21695 [Agrobacterium tumefaciens]|nr:hypothetical protein [Agrobacterium tumefaciens]NTD93941.1 hypothetical protein [Agrobacterium tumefaciens]NTE03916.1 hypothetical protein [Agrobacterium tumefaciens]NTE11381.1 hypothetical protein [Agrobacterium tumefaciens]NTE26131.1 hypothetical protein [Agrobacterium tumefaciens]